MNLSDRLNAALGNTYVIERELGGGGMSSVFVARETALERAVVLKVLPPEMAAEVSEDRFRREVLLGARLQHPHIVPILSAGDADGLLYYTMPLVEGETLRSRLSREGELPIADAIRILSCVADAIAYAHSHNVVHRDIKPENILLTGQHAVVTDFGVAKALGDASSGTPLTATGLAIGTAAYMAPEQIAADPNVDHRVDIYALGIVAYELLAGTTPFPGRTAQQLAAAHLTQQPEAITIRRGAVPAGLAALVMSCLEKRPSDRPQSAAAVANELAQLAVSGGQTAYSPAGKSSRRRVLIASALAVILALFAGTFAMSRSRTPAASVAAKRVVVAALTNESGDEKLASFGKMAADWVTQGLQETGFIDVVDSRTVLRASQKLSGQDAPAVEELSKQTGASLVVWGSYYIELDSLIVRAQIVNAADGKVLRTVAVGRVSRTTPTVALEALREKILAALAPLVDPRLSTWETTLKPPSYAAYQAYMDGLENYASQSNSLAYDLSAEQFAKAVKLDSTFQTARLWEAFNFFLAGWTSNSRFLNSADSVILVLQRHRGELSPFDRRFFNWLLALRRSDMPGTYLMAKEMMIASPGSAYAIWEAALAALRTNRPKEALELLERPQLTHGPSGALSLDANATWKAAALHLSGEYQKEMDLGRANHIVLTEARGVIGLGDTAAALTLAKKFLDQSGIESPFALAQLRALVEELSAHGHPAASRTLALLAMDAYDAATGPVRNRVLNSFNAASIEYSLGRFESAKTLLPNPDMLDPGLTPTVLMQINVMGLLGAIAARTGNRAEADRLSLEIEARKKDVVVKPLATYWRARIAAAGGDSKTAISLYRRAVAEGYLPMPAGAGRFIHTDPDLAPLLANPEFREIVEPKG